jgi:DNA-binding NarL/FixJ family response regulator
MDLGRFTTIAVTNALTHATTAGPPTPPSAGPLRPVPLGRTLSPVHDAGDALTRREREVLTLVAAGLRNREVAGELDVTLHTVKQHLKHIYEKLGVRTRLEAAQRLGAGSGSR